ncbi:hypothetical protein CCR75_003583 [Bremia lactucae]|uniref:UDENN domain-containing protein n=1 Tax=Bremia lactucae TaxID=4779 RepID=A0A976FKR4_BRELC|nr:hypothetical protein CCR75_003583 [Bremia lactucae]
MIITSPYVAACFNVACSDKLPTMRSYTNLILDALLFGDDKASENNAISQSPYESTTSHSTNQDRLRFSRRTSPVSELSNPHPVSSKLFKLFRPNGLHSKRNMTNTHLQVLNLDIASFNKLQGHMPLTLKEIVKDPKKLPYLLQWLLVDTEALNESTHSNYHHVLLFLMEIEQLQTVNEKKRREQANKIWHKYIDNSSEFQISETLELPSELEQLVKTNITTSDKVNDIFFPIQNLAYMRLTQEEMPRFLKSDVYLKMLIDTEVRPRKIPMERLLQQPRAAHYFLFFLMQSRQHFELYFWLHVEYVLKHLLDINKYELFWRLACVLVDKAQNNSQAITLATKNDLYLTVVSRRFDDDVQSQQPVAEALFMKAQEEICIKLLSSWYEQFITSDLYKVALQDPLIYFDLVESREFPPKLSTISLSAEYSKVHNEVGKVDGQSSTRALFATGAKGYREEAIESKPIHVVKSDQTNVICSDAEIQSDSEEIVERNMAKIVLNLEGIIRLTKLPPGLQVHYRPNFNSLNSNAPVQNENDFSIKIIFTFATFIEKENDQDLKAKLLLMPVPNPFKAEDCREKQFDEISRQTKPFLVPSGRILIQHSSGEKCPPDVLFPFQQSDRHGFLFGSVYLTYELMHVGSSNEQIYVAKGFCLLSHLPLVSLLRKLAEEHIQSIPKQSSFLAHEQLALLYHRKLSWKRPTITSHTSAYSETKSLNLRKFCSSLSLPSNAKKTDVDVPLTVLFKHFGTAMALQILASAVLECSIVLVASQYSVLAMCAEAIRYLLRPFTWCHVYAPVLPKSLLSYLQCPTPILVGVNSEFALRSDLPARGFYLVADVDRKVVEYVGNQRVAWRGLGLQNNIDKDAIFLPRCFEAAKLKLDGLLYPEMMQYDSISKCGTTSIDTVSEHASSSNTEVEQLSDVCVDLFLELLCGHANACLVVGDATESVVIFDETEFLSTRAEEDLSFYRALLRTQCFSEIISAHRIDIDFKELDKADEDLQEGII